MPRLSNDSDILGVQKNSQPVDSTWIEKLNTLVGNVKSTITEIKPIVEIAKGHPGQSPMQGGLQQFLALLKASGYADKPIGELITMIAPFTINQLEDLAKSKFLGGASNGTGIGK